MKALTYARSPLRYAAANVVSRLTGGSAVAVGPVQLGTATPPQLPADGRQRVAPTLSGICGSDLSAIAGHSSRYFESIQSFPFVLGHEIVGTLDDGSRVVVEPALGCVVRGIEPLCPSCSKGSAGTCYNLKFGDIAAGPQTGYCKSTGGGWSEALVAHESQLHRVPDEMSDESAVMIEPTACAVHAVTGRATVEDAHVAVVGAGTLGLSTIAALSLGRPVSITVGAKYPHQKKFAAMLGATHVVSPKELSRSVRLTTRSLMAGAQLTGGADVVFDCVGNSTSLTQAMQMVRPRGRIVMMGMPARLSVDMAPLWHREIELVGAYCYGTNPEGKRDFAVAAELVQKADLGRLVTAKYPLTRHKDALEHAGNAGMRGAVKIVFDLRRQT